MTDTVKLKLLKLDLQKTSTAEDDYLNHLLSQASLRMQKEGIIRMLDDELYDSLEIQYAAYLYRKRAGTETGMPVYLRKGLNDLLFSQKGKGLENASW